MVNGKIIFCLVGLMVIYIKPLFAEHKLVDEQEEWSPVSAGPLTTWTTPLCGKGKFVAQPFFFYNWTRGSFNGEGNYNSLPDDDKKYQFQEQLFMQYGLTEKLEVDAQTVYQQNFISQTGKEAHSQGFGDSFLFLRYCFFEEKDLLPHLAGLFQVKFPTGKYQKADADRLGTDLMGATSGGGSYDLGFGFNLTKKKKPFIFHIDSIYNFPQEVKVNGINTKYARYLNYDFGVEYFLVRGFNLMSEFNGFLQGDKRENGAYIPSSDVNYLNTAAGIGWSCNKLQTLLAYQRTLIGTNTDANDSVVLTFVYTF